MLAIQMLDWKDVLPVVASSLGNDTGSHAVILDFLKVLPEEVNEGRKVTLTVRGLRYAVASRDFFSLRRRHILVNTTKDAI